MSLTIFCVSRRGTEVALDLAGRMAGAIAFVPSRFAADSESRTLADDHAGRGLIEPYDGKPGGLIAERFAWGEPLVLVMAVGAAVRLIAPHLRGKALDPPVVVVDDNACYAISLVSGHAGGANDLARVVAAHLNAQAIVTTASDATGLPAIDEIARERGWWIEPSSALTRLAAALINGESVGIYQDAGERDWLDDYSVDRAQRFETLDELYAASPSTALVISDRLFDLPANLAERTVICRPPVLVLGLGCSSGAGAADIAKLVDTTLQEAGLSRLSAYALATIGRRRWDPAIVEFAKERRLQIVAYSAQELEETVGDWAHSDVVRRAVGASAVAEPAALRCAGVAILVVRKRKSARVTVAVARVPSAR
jgi:cobalamin biosynthesis protein CbiG